MDIENKSQEILEKFKQKMLKSVDEALGDAYSDILPHVESDTVFNVNSNTRRVVENIIAGDVEYEDGYLIIEDQNGISVRIAVELGYYNNIRSAIINAMPACPKDIEIKSLKEENGRLLNMLRGV